MTEQQKSSALAITSLVLGLLSLACGGPIFGIPGLICGLVALSKANKGEAGGQGLAIAGTITSALGTLTIVIIAAMLLPVLSKAREKARRANCSGNLKQLGIACLMYSGDYSGHFPVTFDTLDTAGYMHGGNVYRCPSVEAPGTSTPSAGDYLYFGAGIRDDNSQASNVVIACDKPGNHNGEWMNLLFVDAHVTGVKASSLEEAAKLGYIIPGINDQQ